MKAREVLGMAASACGVLGFVAGTAASTVNGGIVYAAMLFGPFVILVFLTCGREVEKGERPTFEIARNFSEGELYAAGALAILFYGGMYLDASERGGAWNLSFGLAQVAGVIFCIVAAVILWEEWVWHRDRQQKKCPECAHLVLAEARKCEHCAYRFDVA